MLSVSGLEVCYGVISALSGISFEIPQGAIVTLTRNGHTKRVVDYAGTSVGMPEAVHDIEQQIDRVANTAQWVRGGEQNSTER